MVIDPHMFCRLQNRAFFRNADFWVKHSADTTLRRRFERVFVWRMGSVCQMMVAQPLATAGDHRGSATVEADVSSRGAQALEPGLTLPEQHPVRRSNSEVEAAPRLRIQDPAALIL